MMAALNSFLGVLVGVGVVCVDGVPVDVGVVSVDVDAVDVAA
jgi:hypothetical protein